VNDEIEFDAFISYSHNDAQLAERLSRRLRSYSPPRASGLGRRKLSVFRDLEVMTAAPNVVDELHSNLEKARYLVVLASRSSAESEYVGAEVERFLALRGRENVRIVLCEGEYSDAVPEALRGDEPLYIDLRDPSRRRFRLESLRLIASIHGVGYLELRREDDERRRRRRTLAATVLLLVTFLLGSFYVVSTTPAESWLKIPQPVTHDGVNALAPVKDFAVRSDNPWVVAWYGQNARYARARSAPGGDDSEAVEHLIVSIPSEFVVFSNDEARQQELQAEQESEGGSDVWDAMKTSGQWSGYRGPKRVKVPVHFGGVDPQKLTKRFETKGVSRPLTRAIIRSLPKGDGCVVTLLSRGNKEGPSVAVLKTYFEDGDPADNPPVMHFYRAGKDHNWRFMDLDRRSEQSRVEDVFRVSEETHETLVWAAGEGFFRTRNRGERWETTNLGESSFELARSVKSVLVGPELYALAVFNTGADGGVNPLFRLERRGWIRRWRVGVSESFRGD